VAEEQAARIAAAEAALEALEEAEWTREDTVERLRALHAFRRRRFATLRGDLEDQDGIVERSLAYQRLMYDVIEAQRAAIVRMRNEGLISAEVMRRVERDLDLEESRLEI
jgi:monovalent cation/hydrogen antiporter